MTKTKTRSGSPVVSYLRENGITVAIVVVGAGLLYMLAKGSPHPLEGQPAPEFSLPSVTGETISLAAHAGKDVVVLDFWASWCPPCRKGLPALDAVAKRYAEQPVAVYAVNIREGESLVKRFVDDMGLSLSVLLDDTGMVADDYGVSGIPQTVVIGKDGVVHAVHIGVPFVGFEDDLAEDIEAALSPDAETEPPSV